MTPRAERTLDWVLVGIALSLAAAHLWMATAARPRAPRVGVAELRSLEDIGKIHDAGHSYPAAVRSFIGLEGDGTSVESMISDAHDRASAVAGAAPLQLLFVAMAVSYEVDPPALRQLDELAQRDDVRARWQTLLHGLLGLADGRPAAPEEIARLDAELQDLGASPWLRARVRGRALANAGDAAGASAARDEAAALAIESVDARMYTLVTELLLIVFGLGVLIALPWARRRLARHGYPGLGPAPSPFRIERTQRVLVGWFVGSLLAGWLFGSLGVLIEAAPRTLALLLCGQVLAHGAIGVALIQRFARREADPSPLGSALGFGWLMLPKRALGLSAWAIAGLGVAVFIATASWILNLSLFGAPTSSQSAVELLVSDGSAATFSALALSTAVFAPVVEEIIFRGLLFRNLRAQLGVAWAAIASGLIFGAVHLDPERVLPLAGLGAALALLYEWSGSLLVPVVVHGLWNLLQLVSVYAIYQAG